MTNVVVHRSPARVRESWAVLQGRNYALLRPPNLCGERHGRQRCAGSRCARSRAAKKSPKQFVIRRIVIHCGGRSAALLGMHGRSGPVPGDNAQRCANFARCSSEIVILQTHEGEGTSDFGLLCTVAMGGMGNLASCDPWARGAQRDLAFCDGWTPRAREHLIFHGRTTARARDDPALRLPALRSVRLSLAWVGAQR